MTRIRTSAKWAIIRSGAVLLLTIQSGTIAFAGPGSTPSPKRDAKPEAAAKHSNEDGSLKAAFSSALHQIRKSSTGLHSEIPENRLEANFKSDGAITASHPEAGSFGLRLVGIGYGDAIQASARPSSVDAAGNRVEYRRGSLTEWYVSDARGLEQGFTLSKPPATHTTGQRLCIELAVTGGLEPVAAAGAATGNEIELRRKDDGRAVLVYSGLKSWDSTGRRLPGQMSVESGGRIRLQVADAEAVYPVTVDPWVQQAKLTASDAVALDYFGSSVSVSSDGNTAVIGAYGHTLLQGAAYVFTRSGSVWSQQQELAASDAAFYDYAQFGISVSVSGDGNTAVIGANQKKSSQGAAYVFTRSGSTWSQQQKLTASDAANNDQFGYSVAVSGDGNTAVIGASNKIISVGSAAPGYTQGAVYVFTRSGSAWSQQQELTASDAGSFGFSEFFGGSVAVSGDGNTAVIGASGATNGRGAAYVFTRSGSTWWQQQKLEQSDSGGNSFGYSVSLSADGNTTVIGAPLDLRPSYVFTRSGSAWSQQQKLTASDATAAIDNFGRSVSVSGDGNTAVIGASAKSFLYAPGQGVAYVFTRSGVVWSQQKELIAFDGATDDEFGNSVSVSGDGTTAVVGASFKNFQQGAAYMFHNDFSVISNVQWVWIASGCAQCGLLVTWTTDQPSTSQVNYGPTPNYGSVTPLDSNLVTNHSVLIPGLAAGRTYNFQVLSTNGSTISSASTNSAVTTTPNVGYLAFWSVTNSGVSMSWSTDVPANTVVAYGTTTALGQMSPVQPALTNNHGVVLTGLMSGTTYYFRALSTDANGNTGGSTIQTFTTTGVSTSPAPIITGVNVTGITSTAATINWTTDQASTSLVNYGLTSAYGSSSPLVARLVTAHSITLTGLNGGTMYNFDVVSQNATGTATGTSANYTFSTLTSTGTPPVISNVVATPTSPTSATIAWTTDQPSWTQLKYGLTSAYGSSSPLDTSLLTSHSVTLSGLTANTIYNFAVLATNAGGTSATAPNGTFQTPPVSSAPPPSVGYVAFWGITNTGLTISWSTDVPANTQVAYGTSTALGQLNTLDPTMVVSHGVTLTGLNPGTTYYFQARSTGANGSTGTSTTYSFTTTGVASAAPVISNVLTSGITNTSAVVTWTTDQPSTSKVNYGTTPSFGSSTTTDPTLVNNHSVMLTNLSPGTTYNFDVVSGSSTSGNYTFQTTGTAATSPTITNVTTSGLTSSMVTIQWTTDQPSTSLVNYGTSVTFGSSSQLDTTLVTSHTVTLTGLTPATLYNFTVVSANAAAMSTTSTNRTFTTQSASATAPVVSSVAFWGITSSGVTISWATNVPANTQVAYGATTALGQLSPLQTPLTASHGVTLTGLASGTTYYFVAQSADINGVVGTSTQYSFVTVPGTGPVISGITATPASNHTATISWTTSTPASSYAIYGTTAGVYGTYSAPTLLTTSPVCNLPYVPSGTIHYQLVSTDAYGNRTVSPDLTLIEP